MARCLTAYGVTRNDIFSVAYGYGLFTGGLGAHYGVEHLGASVIPAGTGNVLVTAKTGEEGVIHVKIGAQFRLSLLV